ncbi:MAG TPA: hypothetical protein VM010_08330 [Chitinophagaceae bacterium]|nr:hypothetical protein [Chitinophagaceae bacterium]
MKVFLLLCFSQIFIAATCNKTTSAKPGATKNISACYKARLAIKGACMNYVIEVLEGDTAHLALEKKWTDETDQKTYTNVFALGSRCTFPDIAEGDTLYFTLIDSADANCNVCMAYRPVPAAKNYILVSKTPCP